MTKSTFGSEQSLERKKYRNVLNRVMMFAKQIKDKLSQKHIFMVVKLFLVVVTLSKNANNILLKHDSYVLTNFSDKMIED